MIMQFDHNINSNIDGHIYENIIRMIPCNFYQQLYKI